MTIMISAEMNHYRVGNRVKRMESHKFVVSKQLYDFLYSNKQVEHWNHHFSIQITKEFVEELDKLCFTVSELDFLRDVKKVHYLDNITIEQIFIKKTFEKIVEKVDWGNMVAYFKSKNGKTFEVGLSDKAIYDGIKEKDKVRISVLMNDTWIVTEVTESYDEEVEKIELQRQMDEFEDLIGGY